MRITLSMTAPVKAFGCRPSQSEPQALSPGAGVRKPPRDETAGTRTPAVQQARLWGFEQRPCHVDGRALP
jgi:hypothetical protein